jgi:hypothetical protein
MFSIIVSTKDESILNSTLLPSLEFTKKYLLDKELPELQIVIVSGEHSLSKNYNSGIDKSVYKMKFFIHDDLNINDKNEPPFLIKVNDFMNLNQDVGLVGLVGTSEKPKGFWWNCKRSSISGHVLNREGLYWDWKIEQPFYYVNLIDGMFMATQTDIRFSEDIEGFNFYDLDYCQKIKTNGYKIAVIPHLTIHNSQQKNLLNTNEDYYNKKWNLN